MHDLDRIIFLDADTLIFKDLFEMYTLPFNGNYALGFPFHTIYSIDNFVKGAKYYINVGVMLLNLKKIRNDYKDSELIRFTFEKNKNLYFPEQDSLNIVFFKKIGILPLKYGIFLFVNIDIFKKRIQKKIRIKLNETEIIIYPKNYLINSINEPSIVHLSCCNPKVWHKESKNVFGSDNICKRYHKEFYYYANKTNYFSEIYKNYID